MMRFKSFTEEVDCRRLWEKFSPKVGLWDLWDFNRCFFDPGLNKLCFVVGYDDGVEVGLLPLQFEKAHGYYCFFGGSYPERRSFFIKDKARVIDFLDSFRKDLCLEYIDDCENGFVNVAKFCDSSFSLDLEKFSSVNAFFGSFGKKHKKNLKYDLKQLEKLDYDVFWNVVSHFERLVELNRLRFGDDSNYAEKGFEVGMKRLVGVADEKGMLNMVSIKVGKNVEAVEIGVLYNKVYYVLDGGCNNSIENLGKLLIVKHLEKALELDAVKIDFLSGDSGWKRLWNLDETKQWEWSNFECSEDSG